MDRISFKLGISMLPQVLPHRLAMSGIIPEVKFTSDTQNSHRIELRPTLINQRSLINLIDLSGQYQSLFSEIGDIGARSRSFQPLTQDVIAQHIQSIYEVVGRCAQDVFGLDGLRVYSVTMQAEDFKVRSIYDRGINATSRSQSETQPMGEKLKLTELIGQFIEGRLIPSKTDDYAVVVGQNNNYFAWLLCDRSKISEDFNTDRKKYPDVPENILKQNFYIVTRRDKKAIVYMLPIWNGNGSKNPRLNFTREPKLMIDLISHAEIAIENMEYRLMAANAERERASDKSGEMTEAMYKMILSCTHDANNKLTNAMGLAHILSLGLEGDFAEYAASMLESCRALSAHNKTIANLAKNMASAQSAVIDVNQRINLRPFLVSVLNESWAGANPLKRAKIKFNHTFEGDIKYFAKADPDLLRNIVSELIQNALKYTDAGEITVWIKMIEDGRKIEISIRDTGRGIPEDELEKIFGQYRGSNIKGVFGTGMGLFLQRYFAELIGGELKAFSGGPGKSTTFVLEIRPFSENSEFLIGN